MCNLKSERPTCIKGGKFINNCIGIKITRNTNFLIIQYSLFNCSLKPLQLLGVTYCCLFGFVWVWVTFMVGMCMCMNCLKFSYLDLYEANQLHHWEEHCKINCPRVMDCGIIERSHTIVYVKITEFVLKALGI